MCKLMTEPQHWGVWHHSTVRLCCRRGARSVTSSKASSRTSTTAPCSVWTVRKITPRRTRYLVRLPLRLRKWIFKKARREALIPVCFSVLSHQGSVLCYWNRPEQRRLQQRCVHVQMLKKLASNGSSGGPRHLSPGGPFSTHGELSDSSKRITIYPHPTFFFSFNTFCMYSLLCQSQWLFIL